MEISRGHPRIRTTSWLISPPLRSQASGVLEAAKCFNPAPTSYSPFQPPTAQVHSPIDGRQHHLPGPGAPAVDGKGATPRPPEGLARREDKLGKERNRGQRGLTPDAPTNPRWLPKRAVVSPQQPVHPQRGRPRVLNGSFTECLSGRGGSRPRTPAGRAVARDGLSNWTLPAGATCGGRATKRQAICSSLTDQHPRPLLLPRRPHHRGAFGRIERRAPGRNRMMIDSPGGDRASPIPFKKPSQVM